MRRFGGLEIDRQLHLRGLHYRRVALSGVAAEMSVYEIPRASARRFGSLINEVLDLR
jgi:hypothetical protein